MGSHTIKLAHFSIKKSVPFLENVSFLPVPEGCVEQGDLIDIDPFADAFPEFIGQNLGNSVADLYISISGRSVLVKKLEILKAEKKLRDALVQEEASQNLPHNLEDLNYDYMEMSAIPPSNENKINILLVGAKADIVSKVSQLVENAGHRCLSVDMGAFTLVECVNFIHPELEKKNESVLLLDIGKSGTGFIVLKKGELIFSRYMMVGSDFYTLNLTKEMGTNYLEAESLKMSWCSGEESPPEVERIMKESENYFCNEIFTGYEYFTNQFPKESFSKAYVTGGGSKIKNLIPALSKQFGIPFHLLDPFENKKLEANSFLEDSLDHIKHFVPQALGACVRGIM